MNEGIGSILSSAIDAKGVLIQFQEFDKDNFQIHGWI